MGPSLPPPPSALLEGAALFLDFDGTLVDLADEPGAVHVPSALPDMLRGLCNRLEGRLAIVSGRAIADLERHLDCSGLAVSGSHGMELRLAGGVSVPLAAPPELEEIAAKVRRFAEPFDLLVEEKPAGVALHYRRDPDQGENAERFMAELAERSGMVVQHGKMIVELRPRGADKGDALRAFMAEPSFAGARPLFVGDDLTDEHAFEAAADLGGAGVLVGAARPTAARYRLDDVEAVAAWLGMALR